MKFIVYNSIDEVIVTTPKEEAETIRLFFTEGGRDLNEFDRKVVKDCAVEIGSGITVC